MEVTEEVVELGRRDVLISNDGPDILYVGEVGQPEADWYGVASGSSVSVKASNNEVGVVSDGVSEVGVLYGGTGVFPPPVDIPEVDLSGYVTKAMYDADTILMGNGDNNPQPITIGPGQVIGRGNSGNIKGLTPAETAAIVGTSVYGQPQTVNPQTGTTYTPVAGDAGKMITLSNAAAITVSLPQDSAATIAIGTYLDFLQLGAGQVTLQAGSGATVRLSGLTGKIRAQYARAGAQKIAANTWSVFGDLAAS